MRLGLVVFFAFLLIVFLSCEDKSVDLCKAVLVNRHYIYNQDSIIESDTFMLKYKVLTDSICYNYVYPKDTEMFLYQVVTGKRNLDSIKVYNENCPLLEKKIVVIDDFEYEILKYDYDVKGSSDEETYYFFCRKYGLLVVDNYTEIGIVFSFNYDSVSSRLVQYMLERKNEFGITDFTIEPPNPLYMKWKK